jgi:hypothetical protein
VALLLQISRPISRTRPANCPTGPTIVRLHFEAGQTSNLRAANHGCMSRDTIYWILSMVWFCLLVAALLYVVFSPGRLFD